MDDAQNNTDILDDMIGKHPGTVLRMNEVIYILLPVHNRRETTRKFISCLKKQSNSSYHLILIDDGSTDSTAEMVRDHIPATTVLQGKGNWWWAGGLQKGFDWLKNNEISDSSIILLINDDVTFEPDFLEKACSVLGKRKGVLLLSRFSCNDNKTITETGVIADLRRLSFRTAEAGETINCLSTRGLFVRFGDIKVIGNFHTCVLPHYLSDYEYTIRAVKKGMHCETNNQVFVCPDPSKTGYHSFAKSNFPVFLKNYFSIKSAGNPLYYSVFSILCSPKLWVLPNLARVWFRSIRTIIKQLAIHWKIIR